MRRINIGITETAEEMEIAMEVCDMMEPIEAIYEPQAIEIATTLSQHDDGCPVKKTIMDCLSAHCNCDISMVYASPAVMATGHAMSCNSIMAALEEYPESHCTCKRSPAAEGMW